MCGRAASITSPHFDVELMHVFPGPERLVEPDRGPIAFVIGPKLPGNAPKGLDESGGNPLAAVSFRRHAL